MQSTYASVRAPYAPAGVADRLPPGQLDERRIKRAERGIERLRCRGVKRIACGLQALEHRKPALGDRAVWMHL